MSISVGYAGTSILQNIQPESIECAQLADMGETATGAFTVEDDAAALTIIGYQALTISESACSQPRLFTGWTFERGYQRDAENAILTSSARTHDVSIIDMNACFGFRQITGTDGNRSAETWAARLTWILGSEYLRDWISSDQSFVVTNTTMMDAADYRGSYPSAVMQDLSDRSGNAYDYFAFWDPAALEVRLFFDNAAESIGDSTLRISNVLSDWDGLTTFGPDKLAKLQRESDQVYSDVCVNYADGTLKLYRSRPSTYATFVRRSTQIDRPYTRSAATARLQADAWLTKHAVETDRITCIIRVPASRAGLIQAGQRIQFKASHMPNYEAWTWVRVVMCTPKPADETCSLYDIALELVGARPVVDYCECLEGEDGTFGTGVLTAAEGREFSIGPIHVPAHCTLTVDTMTWTEYTNPGRPDLFPPCRIGAHFRDDGSYHSLSDVLYEEFANNSVGIKVTPGADFGARSTYGAAAGTGMNLDDTDGPICTPDTGGGAFGMIVENISDDDYPIYLQVSSNSYFESAGTWSVTTTYHCGGGEPEPDVVTDLGPTNGATTAHDIDPTVDDDETAGYTKPGMIWVNVATNDVFVLTDPSDGAAVWVDVTDLGAPTTADYLVGTAQAGLSAEIVVGTTPGGELGGTWASPTVDATHSGSAHLALGATSSTAAAGDHTHAGGELLITDTPAGSPLIFADILQNEAGTDLLYSD